MSKRVLIAGLFHETHTFLEETTPLSSFEIRRGKELLEAHGDGSPLAGVVEVAAEAGWEPIPVIDLRATPSGTVADAVVALFCGELEAALQNEVPNGLDGICLVLHGAMVSESVCDVEGELIDRIRAVPGTESIPVCGVLDLHGNISRRTAERTQGLIAYRSNPHIDAHQAAVDGARLLEKIFTLGRQPTTVWEQCPVMWPPTGLGTADDPMRTLEASARTLEAESEEIEAVNVFGGFSFADTPDTGVCFTAVTWGDPEAARSRLRELRDWVIAERQRGCPLDPPLPEIMPRVRQHVERGETPVLLVEPSDNIGGGAPGDGTSVLRQLIEHRIADSGVIINDPEAVRRLSSIEPGATIRISIGGRGSRLSENPVDLEVTLVSKSDGHFELEDRQSHLASMCGTRIEMGRCAVVQHAGIRILLTSRKTPPFDLGQWRSQGIDPERLSVIGVKAAVAHRRAYDDITAVSYTVDTPGPCSSNLRSLGFQRVRRPIFPLDV